MYLKRYLITLLTLMAIFCFVQGVSAEVEIDLEGLSPAAQNALENMSKERKVIKNDLAEPITQLKALRETYKNSCGGGKPKDSGCIEQFNQIIEVYSKVMTRVGGFLKSYNQNLEVVVSETEPQLQNIAYSNSLSDLNEDLINKYDESGEEYEDEFASIISEAFGLGEGLTELEMTASSYINYKREYKMYSSLQKQLNSKIRRAQKVMDLGPILNETTKNELAGLTNFIFGRQVKKTSSVTTKKPRSILR